MIVLNEIDYKHLSSKNQKIKCGSKVGIDLINFGIADTNFEF